MITLRAEPYEIPAAEVGPENPLPVFRGPEDDGSIRVDPNMPEEDRRYLGWRTARRVLPYRMQDGYNRDRRVRPLPSLVLENEHLRATFLQDAGGRMVSLYHKTAGRELLHRNPVFQPANLALRNAWFSGGVEWNPGGPPGHHYLTCSPVFAGRIEGLNGQPALRLYEWDRVQRYPWQIDFHLLPDTPLLFVHVRLTNPHDYEIPMYWWTNIAVDERPDVRVLVPADTVLCHAYRGQIEIVELPLLQGNDMTYARVPHAFDFFSRIPDGQRKWVAALDGQGRGLVQTSTDRLRGRKLFCWGTGQGGRRWQEFLAEPGQAYVEIQAGLARTQMERIPMPAGAVWEWTEAFGLLEADAAAVHGEDWSAAWRAADTALERLFPRSEMEAMDRELTALASQPPVDLLATGSGWAALERRRLAAEGLVDPFPPSTPFPDATLGPEQEPWLTLLETGALPPPDPGNDSPRIGGGVPRRATGPSAWEGADPGALMTQPEWRALLEESVLRFDGNDSPGLRHPNSSFILHPSSLQGDHWLAWYHLGNLRMESRDYPGAREAWERSLERGGAGWALRNLAVLEEREGRKERARDLLRRAWEAGPRIAALAVEYAQALAQAARWPELMDFVKSLPEEVRGHERILLAWARSALETGDLEGVERVFSHEFATIREGEVSLTDLWFAYHERRVSAAEGTPVDDALRERVRRDFPPPRGIDFRLHE